ncbi:tol-pal system YbgF family protein [Aquimarina sp. RZ0]|uniref:tetratricopeptide repeat protein n=1 Tax=Aquimarina sp. RZ0 TaxID=2607730 RepID=UPI0011F39CEC|nr:tetratricopeptide repeat protein [Aquimarina sp. RZ0]KAA1244781.1 tetratricopeptide repeat protein [Aquimarina sp. RZ0]
MDKDTALINKIVDLALSDTELSALKERLYLDPDFKKKVSCYLESEAIVNQHYETAQNHEQIATWKEILDIEITSTRKKNTWKWIGGIAASFLLFFGILQTSLNIKNPELTVILKESWNKKIGLDYNTLRGADKNLLKTRVLTAFRYYENKEYDKTIQELSELKTTMPYYEDALLLRGLSLFKIGNIDEALKTLDTLSRYPTGKKNKEALWYKGLIHLELGNIKLAKRFLKIPDKKNTEIKLKK